MFSIHIVYFLEKKLSCLEGRPWKKKIGRTNFENLKFSLRVKTYDSQMQKQFVLRHKKKWELKHLSTIFKNQTRNQ